MSSGKEGLDPIAEVGREALVAKDLCDAACVDVVEETRDVEEQEGSNVACGPSCLYVVDQGGDRVNSGVVWVGSKLCHGE